MRRDKGPERGLVMLSRLRRRGVGDEKVQREKDDIMEAIAIESNEEGKCGGCLGIMGLWHIRRLIYDGF